MVSEDVLRTHLQELRRGTVVVASLVALRRPDYGYALLQRLSDHGFPVDANTLYPLLRRLEDQGLLTSEWNTDESRPRKFYRTSDEGESMLNRLLADLAAVQTSITGLIQGVDR
ncbi:PadR family transcriptional regulator [Micromonospora sp. NPDC051227]|uniref:PadR family transcriptional regulator n=1 Tax=Micromonospora sp. NPDC051227 TaxID=3364285 RepID=UPI00193228FF|nr:helix-turn-helix transcriptional regulator [Micromonospora sp. STR1s_5]